MNIKSFLLGMITLKEDGLRMAYDPNAYERWNFDSLLDDRSAIVINFYAKRVISSEPGSSHYALCEVDAPDGRCLR